MSTAHLIQTVFEFLLVGALVVGFIYEPAIAEWEQGIAKAIKSRFPLKRNITAPVRPVSDDRNN